MIQQNSAVMKLVCNTAVAISPFVFVKNLLQQVRHTLGGLDGCYHQQFRIHIGKADVIASVTDELRQEGTLRSSVSLTERVGGFVMQ